MNPSGLVSAFSDQYPFDLDDFQHEALHALAGGDSVLVAAPTGSGKTLVGEFAVWLALRQGGKAFYTTPLKALSNQKFGDFIALHGASNVGLLTGDNSINGRAPVVVMTTEVLRNMIYERSELLEGLRYVVLDEVHYLQDPYRGAVWEEVIIHLPLDVKVVCLSATVSNWDEFGGWLQTVRGPTASIVETQRPVDLEHHYFVDRRLLPMFIYDNKGERNLNSQVLRMEAGLEDRRRSPRHHPSQRGRPRRRRFPSRPDVVEALESQDLLPAIYFVFSRKGCDASVSRCMVEGLQLTTGVERSRIREYAEMRCSYLSDEDLDVLDYSGWLEALSNGIAAHHAGLLPAFKETVEELFQAGLVKVVFATETLSLGINMPARTVVIESLIKFTGERHELMTPGEFTQLTGRAGRRGIDTVGHAVVVDQPDVPFRQVAAVASTPSYPLLSSFEPSYNMATNLVRNYSRDQAEHLLNSSFAQFRVDKEVVVVEGRIERNEAYLASYREKMACDRGDFADYWQLREKVARMERSLARGEASRIRQQTREVLSVARPGQVYVVPGGRARGRVVVVGAERSKRGEPRVLAVTSGRQLVRLSPSDFERPPRSVAKLGSVTGWLPRVDHDTRKRLAGELEALDIREDESVAASTEVNAGITQAKSAINRHPCHRCPDLQKHSQWAERASRLEDETARLRKRVKSRTQTLSTKFEKILEVLEQYGYVNGFDLTAKGNFLAHIYNESDLLVSEVVWRNWLDGLEPAELAALISTFVFQTRGPGEIEGRLPNAKTYQIYRKVQSLAETLGERERRSSLEQTEPPDSGFADVIYRWSRGASLEEMLDADTTAGDFIRSSKQTLDLLRQLNDAAPDLNLKEPVSSAIRAINRGVVAYTGVV